MTAGMVQSHRTRKPLSRAYDLAASHGSGMIERLSYARAYRGLIAEHAGPLPAKAAVLDIGCGPGGFALACLDVLGTGHDLTLADPLSTRCWTLRAKGWRTWSRI